MAINLTNFLFLTNFQRKKQITYLKRMRMRFVLVELDFVNISLKMLC
jgi:hypothetical protein